MNTSDVEGPSSLVEVGISDDIATLTLHRSRRRNALSRELVGHLIDGLRAAEEQHCRCVVLRAEPGVTTWSAGHDVDELPSDGDDPLQWSSPLEELLRTVRATSMPVIAAVEGGVWGGACDLVFTCDFVIATDTATFAITPAKLGVAYNIAGVEHFLGVLPLHVVKEMFFTADPLPAVEAAQYGLVNRLAADSDDLNAQVAVVAHRMTQMAPLVVAAVKAEFTALTAANPMNPDMFEKLTEMRRRAWRSQDYAEGMKAFHERRPAEFSGE